MKTEEIKNRFRLLCAYVESQDFRGWDPFDGLNSKIFQSIPVLKNNKWARLAWLQFFKRSPFNFRPIAMVPKVYNSKAIALFLIGYSNWYKKTGHKKILNKIRFWADKLVSMISTGYSGAAWGYPFDWQARAFFQPKGIPTVVATSFAVESLLMAGEILDDKNLIDIAISSRNFVLHDLNKSYDKDGDYTFSYSPIDRTQVFNAGLLGAKTLSLIYNYTKEEELLKEAEKVVRYVSKHQQKDGSWAYGTLPFHQWKDSFHTGYNLEAIHFFSKASNKHNYQEVLEKGLNFYLKNFFTQEGIPKYYHNQIYPIDIHSPAQLLVTLAKMNLLDEYEDLWKKVLDWTIKNMQHSNGRFYYQKKRLYTNKIPYIRWSDAWMFYALSFTL